MEAAPPTYRQATLINPWDIIAHYVPSNDLCSAALVSSQWHATFAPHLWGNPASHFGIENDSVYIALTRFKRTLQTARLLVRALTHTLHLPPAHAEIYNGPHANWLRDILERLPNLQSLIVRGLPFFDHSSLQALRYTTPEREHYLPPEGVVELPASNGFAFATSVKSTPSFGLRLLDASRCPNVTSRELAQALGRFENLLYLDLSFTLPAQDSRVLASVRRLTGLQVLKLRGINLTDTALETLAQAIGLRVRSLDIRDNRITDRGVRTLLDKCFASGDAISGVRRSPALLPYLGSETLDIYQGEDFEGYLRNAFTGSFVSRLAIEDIPEGGITHLYIAGNDLTVEGASGLIRSGRLHVVDIASLKRGAFRHASLSGRRESESDMEMPGVEKLTSILWKHTSNALTFLRAEHSLITQDVPNQHPEEVVQGRIELADTALPQLPGNAFELDGTSMQTEVFEMPGITSTRHELAAAPVFLTLSPVMDDEVRSPTARRGSAFAPEWVDFSLPDTEHDHLLSPVSAIGEAPSTPTAFSPISPSSDNQSSQIPIHVVARPRTYSTVADERRAKLTAHTIGRHNLHPAMLPHLTTLILTDVPSHTGGRETADRLIRFITQCAEESRFAVTQAKLDYALPPGRRGHASALKQSADRVFALKRIVLELRSENAQRKSSKASPWQHMETKSMTEDRDSEALWSAAETDFSFFGDGEECSLPSLEPGRFAHSVGSNEKEVSVGNGSHRTSSTSKAVPTIEPRVDTIALLSAFRKDRKLAHQRKTTAGAVDPVTEGYWDGVVQVVRPGGLRHDEEVDYYGNRFTDGWLYR